MKDFKSTYPLITKEDITIGRNITGPTFLYTDEEHSHVLNAVQTSLPLDDNEIRLTEAEMNNLFYAKNERFTLKKLCDAQKDDIALRQVREWKMFNNQPLALTIEISANKVLLHYYRKIKDISLDHKEEINDSLLYIQTEKTKFKKKICLPLCFLLMALHMGHNHKFAGHPGAERTLKNIERVYYFPGLSTWVKILIYDCL